MSLNVLQFHYIRTRRVHVCLVVTCHLHFGQNDRDLLHATLVTRGWNGYESAQKSGPTEEIFSRPSDRGANPRPFDHESAALPLSYLRPRFTWQPWPMRVLSGLNTTHTVSANLSSAWNKSKSDLLSPLMSHVWRRVGKNEVEGTSNEKK